MSDGRCSPTFEVAQCDGVRDAADPGFERAFEPELAQLPVHAQEGFLAQVPRIVRVADHAKDNVPAEFLVVADQRFEGARLAIENGSYPCALIPLLVHR